MRHCRSNACPFHMWEPRYLASVLLFLSFSADATAGTLPNLPGADLPPPLLWQLDEQGAALAYETRSEKWGAKIDQGADNGAAVEIDYGLLLSSKLGAGATFRREGDYSEIVANAVYAHRHNVRFRLAGALLRTEAAGIHADGDASSFRQDSYLLSARKYWPVERFVSDLGIAVYTVAATPSSARLPSGLANALVLGTDEDRPSSVTSGKMDGFMLNLGLRPSWQSRIELRREFSHFDFRPYSGTGRSEFHSSGRIAYQQHLGNCMRVHGGYSAGDDAGRLDIGLDADRWSINLSQDFNDAASGTALYVRFSIPLDGRERRGDGCATHINAPSFSPIMDAALQRPQQFPHEPIAVVTE